MSHNLSVSYSGEQIVLARTLSDKLLRGCGEFSLDYKLRDVGERIPRELSDELFNIPGFITGVETLYCFKCGQSMG